ncbi:hypothetical protein VUR80DRAFT_2018 [Thermomyces stellatus]
MRGLLASALFHLPDQGLRATMGLGLLLASLGRLSDLASESETLPNLSGKVTSPGDLVEGVVGALDIARNPYQVDAALLLLGLRRDLLLLLFGERHGLADDFPGPVDDLAGRGHHAADQALGVPLGDLGDGLPGLVEDLSGLTDDTGGEVVSRRICGAAVSRASLGQSKGADRSLLSPMSLVQPPGRGRFSLEVSIVQVVSDSPIPGYARGDAVCG